MSDPLETFVLCPTTMIIRDQKILLLRRVDWAPLWPGHWHCPIGKMEEGESPLQTAIRETREEVGLDVNPFLGTVVAVKAPHFQNPERVWKDLSLFFVADQFQGEPENRESRLHHKMEWFDLNHLPHPIIPVVQFAIEQYLKGETYGEFGYGKETKENNELM
jgi:8-oxo-dGTP diphosphatase